MHNRKMFRKLLDLDSALEKFYSTYDAKPLGAEKVSLLESSGRVLAEDIFSPMNVPPFDKSIVDGYAVVADDTYPAGETNPVNLKIVERVRTGHPPKSEVRRGQASEVDTGAMIPRGATAVVPIEYTEEEDDNVKIYKRVAHGDNIMFSGTDIGYGELLITKGTVLSFREIGVLSSIGLDSVLVYRKPRVAIFSIGDELVEPGRDLSEAKIYDVNSNLLISAVKENFGEPIFLGIALDDPDDVIDKIKRGLEVADVVLSSGSTSAGTSDIVYRVIDGFGGPGIIAHGLKLAPGKPTVISVLEGKPYIGLPGNPTSALNVFQLIVAPLLWKLAGLRSPPQRSFTHGVSPYRISGDVGRMVIQGVKIARKGNDFHIYPIRSGSGAIRTLGDADGFIVIPPTTGYVDSGEVVKVHLLTQPPQTETVTIFAPPSSKFDSIISKAIEVVPYEVKRFRSSSYLALRNLIQGEAEIAGLSTVDPKTGESNKFLIETLGLGGELEYVPLFERDIGLILNPKLKGGLDALLTGEILLVNYPPNTDGHFHFERLKHLLAERMGVDLEEVDGALRGKTYVTRDYYSAISAVINGRADAGVVPLELVSKSNLNIVKLYKEEYGVAYYKQAADYVKRTIQAISNVLSG